MKILIFLLTSFLIVVAIALQSNVAHNNLVKENAQAILAPNCDGINWRDHCIEVWDDVKCSVAVSGGICSFTYMRSIKIADPKPPPID